MCWLSREILIPTDSYSSTTTPQAHSRDRDKGKPVNASTVLDDGTEVDGLPEFRRYVLDQRADDITGRNVISRLLAFALGRELRFTDELTILELMEQSKHDGHKPRTLLHHLVQSCAVSATKQHYLELNHE